MNRASSFYLDGCRFESYHSRLWVCSLIGKASNWQLERYRFKSDQYPPNMGS